MLDDFRSKLIKKGTLELTVRVRPNAAKTQWKEVLEDGSVKIDLAAPPEKGKANQELIRFLSDAFEIPRSAVEILCGETARVKMVRIRSV